MPTVPEVGSLPPCSLRQSLSTSRGALQRAARYSATWGFTDGYRQVTSVAPWAGRLELEASGWASLECWPELAFLGQALLASQPTALVAVRFELDVILEIQTPFGHKSKDLAPRRDVIVQVGSWREHHVLADTKFVARRGLRGAHEVLKLITDVLPCRPCSRS
jgi:hypothetical protein